MLMVLWGRWSPRRLWAGPGSLGGRGGVAGPSAAPCAASAPRGGPAPVAMGTAAAARLARSSPASVSAAPGAGGVGRVRAAAAAATGERPGAGAGPGRERGCRPLGPGPGRGQGEGRGGAGAVAVGEGGSPGRKNKGSGVGELGLAPHHAARAARSHLLCAGRPGRGFLSLLLASPPARTPGVGCPRARHGRSQGTKARAGAGARQGVWGGRRVGTTRGRGKAQLHPCLPGGPPPPQGARRCEP